MDKIKKFINNNWIFLLFIFPLITIAANNINPDNDVWFLLNGGRYVLEHGIPYIDPFTIHEGLSFVMQQWLVNVIFFVLYEYLGIKSLLGFVFIISLLFMFTFYKLCYIVSYKKMNQLLLLVLLLY